MKNRMFLEKKKENSADLKYNRKTIASVKLNKLNLYARKKYYLFWELIIIYAFFLHRNNSLIKFIHTWNRSSKFFKRSENVDKLGTDFYDLKKRGEYV